MARFHPLTVAEVRRETDACVTIRFALPEALAATFAYRQGQHLILRTTLDGEELRRTYSICAGVDERQLRICVKRQPQGRFSTFANERLKAGDVLEVMPPAGRFFTPLDPTARRHYVAICAGSGITPILSILKTTLATEPASRFDLVYGSRDTASIIFREELQDLKNRHMARLAVHHVLSREAQDLDILNGRIDAGRVQALCRSLIRPAAVDAFFLCGPAPMIGEAARVLEGEGVARQRIHFEYFTPEGNAPRQVSQVELPAGKRDARARVAVLLDGRRTELELGHFGASILDAARAAGVDVPFSCKAGVCCTCRAKVVEGKVDMAVNYALEDWELAAGFVLTCQSRPLTDRVVVDYDAT